MARVLELASLDPAKFEIIVRDNSENSLKAEILSKVKSSALKLLSAPNRGAFENPVEALREATGDYVFLVADDDWISARGFQQLHTLAERAVTDPTVASLTGTYLVDSTDGAGLFRYEELDALSAEKRLESYLSANTSNFLYYSAIRRAHIEFCFDFLARLPYKFSYHDQLVSLMYLALGRTLQITQILYHYDLGEWETRDRTLLKDRAMYIAAGLPVAYDRLHFLFAALEGALVLRSRMLKERASYETPKMIELWFGSMFNRFRFNDRGADYGGDNFDAATAAVRAKWLGEVRASLDELLLDITDLLELCDKKRAANYFEFWSTL